MSEREIGTTAGPTSGATDTPPARPPRRDDGPDIADDADDVEVGRRHAVEPALNVRMADIEPYTGLRYLSKLFRVMALILVLMLVAEVVTGFARQGTASIATLVPEVSRLVVLAGLLWGIGDLAVLLVDIGHDVRATRVLLGRQVAHQIREERR